VIGRRLALFVECLRKTRLVGQDKRTMWKTKKATKRESKKGEEDGSSNVVRRHPDVAVEVGGGGI